MPSGVPTFHLKEKKEENIELHSSFTECISRIYICETLKVTYFISSLKLPAFPEMLQKCVEALFSTLRLTY